MPLWERCNGKCQITHLDFSDEKVGLGQAKRAYAPSLDRIDPEGRYTADNRVARPMRVSDGREHCFDARLRPPKRICKLCVRL